MTARVPISAIVLTAQAAGHVGACLDTLGWADERLVLDAFSTDATLARACGASRVVERQFTDFAAQRHAALQLAGHDWVLFVDADERVPPALAAEIRRRAGQEPHLGYWIPRRNCIFGHWMRASGWAPDRQLRLMHRRAANYVAERIVHELVRIDGSVGVCAQALEHYSYASVAQFRARQRHYAGLVAISAAARGERRRATAVIAQPAREFARRLVTLHGYRDGWIGLLLAILMAEHEWRVQRALRRRSRDPAAEPARP